MNREQFISHIKNIFLNALEVMEKLEKILCGYFSSDRAAETYYLSYNPKTNIYDIQEIKLCR